MLSEITLHVRATRNEFQILLPRPVERRLGELSREALALVLRRNFNVDHFHSVASRAVTQLGQIRRIPCFEAVELLVVAYLEPSHVSGGLGHFGARPGDRLKILAGAGLHFVVAVLAD